MSAHLHRGGYSSNYMNNYLLVYIPPPSAYYYRTPTHNEVYIYTHARNLWREVCPRPVSDTLTRCKLHVYALISIQDAICKVPAITCEATLYNIQPCSGRDQILGAIEYSCKHVTVFINSIIYNI